MTQVIGDATHLKGKTLSGSIQSGESWVFDGSRYIPQLAGSETLSDLSGQSGLVITSGSGLGVISGAASSGAVLMWSGTDIERDAYLETQWKDSLGTNLKQLENSLSMICWDLYSQDNTFSDMAIDDFENQDGVDLFESVAVFDSSGDYYSRVHAQSGLALELDISSADHVDIFDLKGQAWRWVNDSGAHGHFEAKEKYFKTEAAVDQGSGLVAIPCAGHLMGSGDIGEIRGTVNYDGTYTLPDQSAGDWQTLIISGSYSPETFTGSETVSHRLSIGSSGDCPHLRAGVMVYLESGSGAVLSVSGAGPGSGAIELDSTISDSLITSITGLLYDSGSSGLTVVNSSGVVPSGLLMAKTTEAILLSSDSGPTIPWSEIEGVQVTQNKPGTSDILHAVQFGANEVWKVFLNSGWRDIVHNDSGIWKYKDASGLWNNPNDNTELDALYSAMSVSQNQWGKTEIDVMTQSQWHASGGFTSGETVGFAMGLVADGTNVPTQEKYTVTHGVGDHDLVLELNSWEASLNDPDEAYCVIDVQDASSGSPWSSGASGGVHRFRHVGVQQSGKAYFWGGINRGREKISSLDIYDISGDTWSSGAPLTMGRDNVSAVIYNNKMHCFGGSSDESGIVGNLNIYDISGDTWSSGVSCPDARSKHTAIIYNNKMYCWGGINHTYDRINTMSVYDFATSGWSSGTAGGGARTEHTAVERSGRMYCWGGILDDSQVTNTLDIYDFATGLWISGQTGGAPRRGHCAEIVGDKMICFGGQNSSGNLDTVDIYDFRTHSWVTGASLGMDLFCAASFEYSGKMYVWGGMNDQGVFNSMLIYDYSEEFNPQTDVNAWLSINDGANFQQFPELKVFRRVNDRFYLRGDIYDVSAAGDKRVKLKVGVNDLKNIRIQAVSVGVKYL